MNNSFLNFGILDKTTSLPANIFEISVENNHILDILDLSANNIIPIYADSKNYTFNGLISNIQSKLLQLGVVFDYEFLTSDNNIQLKFDIDNNNNFIINNN